TTARSRAATLGALRRAAVELGRPRAGRHGGAPRVGTGCALSGVEAQRVDEGVWGVRVAPARCVGDPKVVPSRGEVRVEPHREAIVLLRLDVRAILLEHERERESEAWRAATA